jgi:hypothetical protein
MVSLKKNLKKSYANDIHQENQQNLCARIARANTYPPPVNKISAIFSWVCGNIFHGARPDMLPFSRPLSCSPA